MGDPHTAGSPDLSYFTSAETEFVSSVHAPTSTQFVASTPGAAAIALPASAPTKRNWQKTAFLAAVVAVIAIIAITRRSPSPPATGRSERPEMPDLAPPQPMGPHTIRADQPPLTDRKAAKDWNKIVEKLHEQRFGEARQRLEDFERKHGESPETRSLATQLDALPDMYRGED